MKAIITAATVAVLLAGCSAESETADSDTPSATRTAAETTPAKTSPAAKPNADERKIRAYLRENFGGEYGPATSWYAYIKSVRIDFETIKAKTDLYDDSDATKSAAAICSALLGAIPDLDEPMAGAEVQDKNGGKITDCQPG